MMTSLDNTRLSCTEHSTMLANSLYHLYTQSSLLDVRLVCDDAHIYAHKAVLAAGSKFFQERLQTLGLGMVDLHLSSASLGVFISYTELRALVEYLYCGELFIPRHRLSNIVALGRSLQVFGFLTDTPSYLAAPDPQYFNEMNYVSVEPPGVMEIPTPAQCSRLQPPPEETCGEMMGGGGSAGGTSVSLPLVSLKPQDSTLLQDPPKYSEPLKIDTNLNILGSTCNISFSELCTAPSLDGDLLITPCGQQKANSVPSVFESSVLEEAPTMKGKYMSQESWEGYSKPDRDVAYTSTVLNLCEETESSSNTAEDARSFSTRDHHHQQILSASFQASRPPDIQHINPSLVEGDTDDATNTVMFLDTLWPDASSPSGVDLENILRTDEMKVVGERWLRSRRPSRVRLKVKDSIGGVSLQDTSQRQFAAAAASVSAVPSTSTTLPAVSPEEETNSRENKENWMVVLQDARPSVLPHLADPSSLLQAAPPQPAPLDTLTQAPMDTPPFHIQSPAGQSIFGQGQANAVPLLASPMPLGASILAQNSCPSNMPVANTSALFGQSSLPSNATPLLTQSNIPIASYLQPPVLSTTDLSHLQHPLSAVPLQAVSVQPLEPDGTLHYTPAVSFPQSTASVLSQPSLSLSIPHLIHHPQPTSSLPPQPVPLAHSSPDNNMQSTSPLPSLIQQSIPQSSIPGSSASSVSGDEMLSLSDSPAPNSQSSSPQPVFLTHTSPVNTPHPIQASSQIPISSPIVSWPSSPPASTSTTTTTIPDSPVPVSLSPPIPKSPPSPQPQPPSPAPTTTTTTTTNTRKELSNTTTTAAMITTTRESTTTITTTTPTTTTTTTAATSTTTITLSPSPHSPEGNVNTGGETLNCTHCSKTYQKMDLLTLHLWDEHNIGTESRCQLCSFTSPLQSSLVKHADTHASQVRPVCGVCGKTFKSRYTLKKHLISHNGEDMMHKCLFCPLMYSQKNNLINHLASKHHRDPDGEPLTESLTCPHCSFVTLAPYKLKRHKMRWHTNKAYKCDLCPYATTEKTALTKHTRTHTKERPYMCETCGFHAPTISTLWRHRRSHTGEKPYECKQCGQQYADSKRLRDHMYKHNNVKPFMCHLCGYTCRRKDNLQTHVKKVHKQLDLNGSSTQHTGGKGRKGKEIQVSPSTPDSIPPSAIINLTEDTMESQTFPQRPRVWCTIPAPDDSAVDSYFMLEEVSGINSCSGGGGGGVGRQDSNT